MNWYLSWNYSIVRIPCTNFSINIKKEQSELSDKNKEENEDEDANEIEKSEPINSVQEEGAEAKVSDEVEKGSEHESSSEEKLDTVEEHTEGNSESVDVVDGGNVNLAFQDESGHENDQPLENVDNVTTQQPTKFHYTNKYFQSFLYIAIESKDVSVPSRGDGEVNDTEFYFWIKIPFNFNIDLDEKKDLDLFWIVFCFFLILFYWFCLYHWYSYSSFFLLTSKINFLLIDFCIQLFSLLVNLLLDIFFNI